MSHWKHVITVDTRDLAPDAVAKLVSEKLLALPENFRALEDGTTTLDDIAAWLTDCAAEVPLKSGRLVEIYSELYDWADTNKLWIYLRE
jgi:hypothetical protein